MFCPDCGSEVAEGRKFCGKCGGQVRAATSSLEAVPCSVGTATAVATARVPVVAPVVAAPAAPKSFMAKIAPFVILLVLVAAGGAWWWFNRPGPAYKMQDPGIYPFQARSADGQTAKEGFIDADGKVLIQPEWDSTSVSVVSGQWVAFNEGFCGVLKNGKWGFIDTVGHLAIPNQFDNVSPFIEGLARVKLGNQFGYIDKTGQYVINPQFDQAGDFHEGLAAIHGDGGWGFINKTGAISIKPHFAVVSVNGFSNGLAAACKDGKCGYIDHNGSFVIKPQFNVVNDFSEGMAAVQISGKWGYVNTSGKIVVNPQFDSTTLFSGGLAVVSVSGQTGTINRQGKYIVNPGQYNIAMVDGDILRVSGSDGNGLLTRDGKWVLKPSSALTGIANFYGKVFYGAVNGQWVAISTSGKVLTGWYKGEMLDSLGQDLKNEDLALQFIRTLVTAEITYSAEYPMKGFTASIPALGPAAGTSDENHAGLIDAAHVTGTNDGYQFAISIPDGTSTGGTNFNYFILAKPIAGHVGRSLCADSTGAIHYAVPGESCSIASPAI